MEQCCFLSYVICTRPHSSNIVIEKMWRGDDNYKKQFERAWQLNCMFAGWWLSMEPEHQFLKKLQPLSDRHNLVLGDNKRFGTYNDKTIGFLLVGCPNEHTNI